MAPRGVATSFVAVLLCFPGIAKAELRYSAGWGETLNVPGINSSWINLQFQTSVPIAVEAFRNYSVPSLYSFTWTEPDASKITNATAMTCPSAIKRFGNTTRCKTLRKDYRQAWTTAWQELEPLKKNGTMIGVFLGDENIWDGASIANLTTVTDMIKADWPEAIIYINEAQDVANCNFNRLGEPIFAEGECFPESLDWFGYDYVAPHPPLGWSLPSTLTQT